MQKEFTATVYIFHDSKVLLHPHKKLSKWLPPGGHIEKNESPPEAAIREVLEETGLEIRFIEKEHHAIDAPNAKSIPRPYLCLEEWVPPHKEEPAHIHIDMIFIATPVGPITPYPPFEWIDQNRFATLDVFIDTYEVVNRLLKSDPLALPHLNN